MVEDKKHKAASRSRRRALFGRNQLTDMERGNNTMVRVCMIGFGSAIAAIAPVVENRVVPVDNVAGRGLAAGNSARSTKSVLNSRAIIARKKRS